MGERSNSLYARRDTATKIEEEPKSSSGADSRERPAPYSLCAHDRIHHIPKEDTTHARILAMQRMPRDILSHIR